MQNILQKVDTVTVCSDKQSCNMSGLLECRENVAITVDDILRIWADRVTLDSSKKTLLAKGGVNSPLSFESEYFYMLADSLFLNVVSKTGYAENVRVHIDGRFIHAERAERVDEYTWRLKKITFTACDDPCPHWSFKADEALLEKYFLQIFHPSLNISNKSIFSLPLLIAPPYSHSRSGPCIPKFSVDKSFGFGVTLPYYVEIIPHTLDTTIGLHWRQKRGVALFNELRHKAHEESFSHINMLYARDRSKKKECPSEHAQHRYWLEGTFVAPLSFDGIKLHNLFHFDFGTDKHIDYDFFNKPAQIEDFFWNAGIVRWYDRSQQLSLNFDRYKTVRSRFTCIDGMYHCCREKVLLKHAPQVMYHSAYKSVANLCNVRHDAFADRVFLHQENSQHFFNHDTFRFKYVGQLEKSISLGFGQLSCQLFPTMQVQSKLLDEHCDQSFSVISGQVPLEGGYRLFAQGSAQWALPELVGYDKVGDYVHYMQPYIIFSYAPKIVQHQWLEADEHDFLYPTLSLRSRMNNTWYIGSLAGELHFSGGYDWRCPRDIFPLRRGGMNNHVLPIALEAALSYEDVWHIRIDQEYNGRNFSLLQLEMDMMFRLPYLTLSVGWVHQGGGVQFTRELLCDIPSFVHVGTTLTVAKSLIVTYSGHFNLRGARASSFFQHVDVLLQQLRVDYNGHCWGVSLGFEEKRFSEQGKVKTEQLYCFSFRLQSLGAFAKYFKNKPVILKAPHYQ